MSCKASGDSYKRRDFEKIIDTAMVPILQKIGCKRESGNRGTSVIYLHFNKILSCDTSYDIK